MALVSVTCWIHYNHSPMYIKLVHPFSVTVLGLRCTQFALVPTWSLKCSSSWEGVSYLGIDMVVPLSLLA